MTIAFDPARLAVFCGSRPGARPAYTEAAASFGQTLVRHGLGLVYGGGRVGLMGTVADATLAAGGEVIGVIPEFMVRPEVAHHGVTELRVVDTMHTRKREMAERAGGFVCLPGGIGTFEELWEAVTWTSLGIQRKPIGLLNVQGYWDATLAMFQHAIAEGFVGANLEHLLVVEADGDALIDAMEGWLTEAPFRTIDDEIAEKLDLNDT